MERQKIRSPVASNFGVWFCADALSWLYSGHVVPMLSQQWPKHFAFSDPMGNPNYDQRSLYYRLR